MSDASEVSFEGEAESNAYKEVFKTVLLDEANDMLRKPQWCGNVLAEMVQEWFDGRDPPPILFEWILEVMPKDMFYHGEWKQVLLYDIHAQSPLRAVDVILTNQVAKFYIDYTTYVTMPQCKVLKPKDCSGALTPHQPLIEVPMSAVFSHWHRVFSKTPYQASLPDPDIDEFHATPIFARDSGMAPVTAEEVKATDEHWTLLPICHSLHHWEMIPKRVRAFFFNIVLAMGSFPKELMSNELFWEHSERIQPRQNEDIYALQVSFLEITTIPHVAVRQLHAIIARRLQKELLLDRRRFNIMTLSVIMMRPAVFASIKFGHTFSLVLHDAVIESLRRAGAIALAAYLKRNYSKMSVLSHDGAHSEMRRGIPSEDPLSPLLLELLLEQAARGIPQEYSLPLDGYPLRALVHRDEVVLVAEDEDVLQLSLTALELTVRPVGLRVVPDLCRAAGTCGVPSPELILRSGALVPMVRECERWFCFQHPFIGGTISTGFEALRGQINDISRTPLSRSVHFDLIKLLVEHRLQGELFFRLPGPNDSRIYDEILLQSTRSMLPYECSGTEANGLDTQEVLRTEKIPQCGERHLVALTGALREWRRCWRRAPSGSPVDLISRYIDNSTWFHEALAIIGRNRRRRLLAI